MTPVPPSDPAKPSSGSSSKIWRAGTLTYTMGGLLVLSFWLLWGDFAWAMRDRSISAVFSLLLGKEQASDTLKGFLLASLPPALTIILGPIIGYKSDRHRGRWGRRIPFLLIPTPIAVLSMVLLAFSPSLGGALHQALGPNSPGASNCALIVLGGSWVVFEVAITLINSIYYALINDVVPREVIGRFFGAFRALTLVAAMIFNRWLLKDAMNTYVWIFLGMAVLVGVAFFSMCLMVKEGEYPPVVPMDVGRDTRGFLQAAKTYFQESFSHPYYRLYYIAIATSWQAFAPVNIYSIYFTQQVHLSLGDYGNCLFWTYFISFVFSYPLGMLVDRFHPLRVCIAVLFLYAAVTLWGGFFIHNPTTFAIALFANGILGGTWFTAISSISQKMLPKAEYAQFFSAQCVIQALVAIFVGFATGVFLDYMHHDYRYTFFLSFGITLVTLVLNIVLYSKFKALGGPNNYVAPEGLPKSSF